MVTYPFGITTLDFAGLATKFGWWSMIISPILEPFLYLWSNLLAFPVWLLGCNYDFKTKPTCLVHMTFKYPEGDLYWNKFYRAPTKLGRAPTGWQCYIDFDESINLSKTGGKGKFVESFFGIINEFDLEIDQGRNKMVATPNNFTWVRGKVEIHFVKDKKGQDKGHHVLFFFPFDGLQCINPFFWISFVYIIMAIMVYGQYSFPPIKKSWGATSTMSTYIFKTMPEEVYEKVKSNEFIPEETDETSPLV